MPIKFKKSEIDNFLSKSETEISYFYNLIGSHGLVILEQAKHNSRDLLKFAKKIGKVRVHEINSIKNSLPNFKEIMLVGNKEYNDNSKGLETSIGTWHTDYAFKINTDCPSILKCEKSPSSGSYTSYIHTGDLYDSLEESFKLELEGCEMVFDYNAFYKNFADKKRTTLDKKNSNNLVPVSKNIIYEHPVTKRKCLFLCFETCMYIVGKSKEESDKIINKLFNIVENFNKKYVHKWTDGDVLMWDNRCTLHRGMPYNQKEVRELHRITVEGNYNFGSFV